MLIYVNEIYDTIILFQQLRREKTKLKPLIFKPIKLKIGMRINKKLHVLAFSRVKFKAIDVSFSSMTSHSTGHSQLNCCSFRTVSPAKFKLVRISTAKSQFKIFMPHRIALKSFFSYK